MHKLVIYPYSPSCLPLCKFFPIFQSKYEFIDLVSPVGLSFAGHDAGFAANRSDLGIVVHGTLH